MIVKKIYFSPLEDEKVISGMLSVYLYDRTYVWIDGWMYTSDFIHIRYLRIIRHRPMPCVYEQSSSKNSDPSDEPQNTILQFSRKRLHRF
jgi:hypothetical protein